MAKAELEITKGNGDLSNLTPEQQEYGELLQDLQDHGVVVDGLTFAKDGVGLIQPPEVKHTNASLLASVPNANNIYKDEKIKGVLLDLMNRTRFENYQQMVYFEEYVEWCEDFGVGMDGPLRYLAALPAIGGLSREQYLQAISPGYQYNKSFWNRSGNGYNPKPKYKEGELT